MNILIACEESQTVCKAFREKGHNTFSCDIQNQSGGHPEWHIMQDVLPLLNGNCKFKTMDGTEHEILGKWDMIIAHPPCTDLAVSGARHFEKKRNDSRQRASIEFFSAFLNAECDKVVIENPIGIISGGGVTLRSIFLIYVISIHYLDLSLKLYNLGNMVTVFKSLLVCGLKVCLS